MRRALSPARRVIHVIPSKPTFSKQLRVIYLQNSMKSRKGFSRQRIEYRSRITGKKDQR